MDDAITVACSGKAVLVVDDDLMVLYVLTRLITRLGCAVLAVSSATSALRVLAENPNVALVITRIELPGVSGLELRAAMQRNERSRCIPVVFMTETASHDVSTDDYVLLMPLKPNQVRCVLNASVVSASFSGEPWEATSGTFLISPKLRALQCSGVGRCAEGCPVRAKLNCA